MANVEWQNFNWIVPASKNHQIENIASKTFVVRGGDKMAIIFALGLTP